MQSTTRHNVRGFEQRDSVGRYRQAEEDLPNGGRHRPVPWRYERASPTRSADRTDIRVHNRHAVPQVAKLRPVLVRERRLDRPVHRGSTRRGPEDIAEQGDLQQFGRAFGHPAAIVRSAHEHVKPQTAVPVLARNRSERLEGTLRTRMRDRRPASGGRRVRFPFTLHQLHLHDRRRKCYSNSSLLPLPSLSFQGSMRFVASHRLQPIAERVVARSYIKRRRMHRTMWTLVIER